MFLRFFVSLLTSPVLAVALADGSQLHAADDRPDFMPTHADVAYSEHDACRLDLWIAEGDSPRPLLVHIHGGGWTGGDKRRQPKQVLPYLEKGISCASINYRHTPSAPLPAPVHDAARAVQFLRSRAAEWNIRTDRILLTGGSTRAISRLPSS